MDLLCTVKQELVNVWSYNDITAPWLKDEATTESILPNATEDYSTLGPSELLVKRELVKGEPLDEDIPVTVEEDSTVGFTGFLVKTEPLEEDMSVAVEENRTVRSSEFLVKSEPPEEDVPVAVEEDSTVGLSEFLIKSEPCEDVPVRLEEDSTVGSPEFLGKTESLEGVDAPLSSAFVDGHNQTRRGKVSTFEPLSTIRKETEAISQDCNPAETTMSCVEDEASPASIMCAIEKGYSTVKSLLAKKAEAPDTTAEGCPEPLILKKGPELVNKPAVDLKIKEKIPRICQVFPGISEDILSTFKKFPRYVNGMEIFICELCHKSFPCCVGLRRHYLTHKVPREPKKATFHCQGCFRSYTSKMSLQRHQLIHSECLNGLGKFIPVKKVRRDRLKGKCS